MPLKESYVIWNHKGGVGKSTLTFHITSHYSRRNPTEKVLVIDGRWMLVDYAFIVNNRPLAVRGHVTNGSFKQ